MINIKLCKIDSSGISCCNEDCNHNPKYHDHIIGDNFFLKQGQVALQIYFEHEGEIYCRDCIDKVYQKMKPFLDSKLWAFK